MWRFRAALPIARVLRLRLSTPGFILRRNGSTEVDNLQNPLDSFVRRHIGSQEKDIAKMLQTVGCKNLEELSEAVIPASIRYKGELAVGRKPVRGESEFLQELKEIASLNRHNMKSLIGMGYYDTLTPPVILRNVLENPQWYTAYTPYQPEVSQGRLECLLNFQTAIADLTGMEVANASLLDEATAAAEAMTLALRVCSDKSRDVFLVDENVHPQTLAVLRTRSAPLGLNIVVSKMDDMKFDDRVFGVLLQYPGSDGSIVDFSAVSEKAHAIGATVTVGTDLLALCTLRPPVEFGADVAFGSAQRFGVPMGLGGPHAAFFATHNKYLRSMPGRVIGISKDSEGAKAYRMALQTREQHIRRERATSNICTAQALLANIAALYAMYHGPEGLRQISERVHKLTHVLRTGLHVLGGYDTGNAVVFDTLKIATADVNGLLKLAQTNGFNFRDYKDGAHVGISLNETSSVEDVEKLLNIFAGHKGTSISASRFSELVSTANKAPLVSEHPFTRTSVYLQHPEFNRYHAEHEMLRYIFGLARKDINLTDSMIPLGSCTMKLNATSEMIPITWPEFGRMHPFVPAEQAAGYQIMNDRLMEYLCSITVFSAGTLQPNSGAQGEYTGLLVIRAYQKAQGQAHRNVCLIPASSHGTNPASAIMAGLKVVVVKCRSDGSIDVDDLRAQAAAHSANLSCAMFTYPSTYGVFDTEIQQCCEVLHSHGAQVYMDGANMNAQVGLTRPAECGADVCHLNLHKTFCIPHGGGGPGMGPICVARHLAPYVPSHPAIEGSERPDRVGAVSAAPYSSASISVISFAYMELMGGNGLKKATQMAILNANYMKTRLEKHFPVAFKSRTGWVAHEFILDARHFKQSAGIEVIDIAKRLQDYGFHAPTMSWPVAGTLMIEPTESESKEELDRLCDALISIRNEIKEIEDGKADRHDNVLKNAPHTVAAIAGDWTHPYSREKAVFPVPWTKQRKFWPTVGRLDDVYGDRHLVCTCPPVTEFDH